MAALDPDGKISWLRVAVSTALPEPHNLIAGIGDDDCAVIDLAEQGIIVATSDYVNANPIMVSLRAGSYFDIGRYLVNCNLADLCGSGAEPIAILTSIMWDRSRPESEFEQLMNGAKAAATSAGVAIIGGDTKLSSRAAYCATAIGTAKTASHLFLKSKAHPGDGVWVSGNLGSCAAAVYGWAKLLSNHEWLEWAGEAIRNPNLPLDLARKASALAMGAGGTDLSDGLGSDLDSICDVSQVGVEIWAEAIPVDPHVKVLSSQLHVPSYAFAFTVGGDLQFLLCANERYSPALEALGLRRVGTVHADPTHRKLLSMEGVVTGLPSAGHRDAGGMSFPDEIGFLLRSQGCEL
jgi:thiamine-monophosphate kinase